MRPRSQHVPIRPLVKETEVARLTRELTRRWSNRQLPPRYCEVISSSTGELQPVFAAIVQNAVRFCERKIHDI